MSTSTPLVNQLVHDTLEFEVSAVMFDQGHFPENYFYIPLESCFGSPEKLIPQGDLIIRDSFRNLFVFEV